MIKYQLHLLTRCTSETYNQAKWLAYMPKESFGERFQATVSSFGWRFGLSKCNIQEASETINQVVINLGSIPARERGVGQVLVQSFAEVLVYFQEQAVLNVDETIRY